MEDRNKDEGLAKKMKYTQPELITLDKDNGVEGIPCNNGSVAAYVCSVGSNLA